MCYGAIFLQLEMDTFLLFDNYLRNPLRSIDVLLPFLPFDMLVLDDIKQMCFVPRIFLQCLRVVVLLADKYLWVVAHKIVVFLLQFVHILGAQRQFALTVERVVDELKVAARICFRHSSVDKRYLRIHFPLVIDERTGNLQLTLVASQQALA